MPASSLYNLYISTDSCKVYIDMPNSHNSESQSIAIVAATSQVGSLVAKSLREKKLRPRLLVRSRSKALELLGEDSDPDVFEHFDYNAPDSAKAAFSGASKIYLVSSGDANMFQQTINLIDLAKACGVNHIVKLSVYRCSDASGGFGASFIGKRHRALEQYIEQQGFVYTHLRPTWYHQNFLRNEDDLRAGKCKMPLGKARFCSIDVRDIAEVAAVALAAAGHENKIYELATDELTAHEAAEMMSRAAGHTIEYEDISIDDFNLPVNILPAEADRWMPHLGESLKEVALSHWTEARAGRTIGTTKDVSLVTGHQPISFHQFVRDNAEALR